MHVAIRINEKISNMNLAHLSNLIIPDLTKMKFVEIDDSKQFVKMEVRDERTLTSQWNKFGLRLISCCGRLPNYYGWNEKWVYSCVNEHKDDKDCLFAEVMR